MADLKLLERDKAIQASLDALETLSRQGFNDKEKEVVLDLGKLLLKKTLNPLKPLDVKVRRGL